MTIHLNDGATGGDVVIPEGDLGLNGEPTASNEPAGTTPADPAGTQAATPVQDPAFYDVNKVPQALQASFKDMQGTWTKAMQSFTPYKDFEAKYGKLDEVQQVLDQLRDPQGVLNWWVGVAQELGVDQAKLSALFQQDEVTPQGATQVPAAGPQAPAANDPNAPMTRAEFQQWQQMTTQQQVAAQHQATEDQQVEAALTNLKVPAEDRQLVLTLAQAHPAHLGYAERIARGHADLQTRYQAAASARPSAPNVPTGLGGGAPTGAQSGSGYKPGSGFKAAEKGAAAFLANLGV